MPPTAQRLREPAAFVLLAFGAISVFFNTISFLFGPGATMSTFSSRAFSAYGNLLNPLLALALVGAVYLAHFGTQMKTAKTVSLVALITIGVAALFGLIAVFASFGADGASGWDKTVIFFVGVAELGVDAVAGKLLLDWYQQHGPARPAAAPGFPQGQWQQQPPQQQWQQPQPPQQGQQQWGAPQPPPPVPPQQQWGTPAPQPQQAPAPQPQQGGFAGGGTDSMMTQAIPTMGQPQAPQAPQPPVEGQGPFGVGNWTAE